MVIYNYVHVSIIFQLVLQLLEYCKIILTDDQFYVNFNIIISKVNTHRSTILPQSPKRQLNIVNTLYSRTRSLLLQLYLNKPYDSESCQLDVTFKQQRVSVAMKMREINYREDHIKQTNNINPILSLQCTTKKKDM